MCFVYLLLGISYIGFWWAMVQETLYGDASLLSICFSLSPLLILGAFLFRVRMENSLHSDGSNDTDFGGTGRT